MLSTLILRDCLYQVTSSPEGVDHQSHRRNDNHGQSTTSVYENNYSPHKRFFLGGGGLLEGAGAGAGAFWWSLGEGKGRGLEGVD